MKKYIIMIGLVLMTAVIQRSVYAASYGEVNQYEVIISENKDASMNMTYHLSLSVTSESIHSVQVKLPHGTKSLISKDNNISSIEFSEDGKLATISFIRSYEAGSTVKFSFALRNANVYEYYKKKDLVKYRITIGPVKGFTNGEMVVKWNASNVYFPGRGTKEGNFYVWRQDYFFLRNFQVMIQYKGEVFHLIEGAEKQNQFSDYVIKYGLFVVAAVIILLEVCINDSYKKNRGFSLN